MIRLIQKISVLALFMPLFSLAQNLPIENQCSIVNATTTLTLINRDSVPGTINESSLSLVTNKILRFSLTSTNSNLSNPSQVFADSYVAPVRLVRDTFVADLSKAVKFSEYIYNEAGQMIGYNTAKSLTKQGLYSMRYEIASNNQVSKFFIEFTNRSTNTVETLGEIIMGGFFTNDDRYVIYKSSNSQLIKLDLMSGLSLPYFNNTLEDLLKDGKSYFGTLMQDGSRLLLFRLDQGEQSVLNGFIVSDQIQPVTISSSINGDESITYSLSNGEAVTMNQANSQWRFISGENRLYRNGVFTGIYRFSTNFSSAINSNNYVLLKSYNSSDHFVVSAAKTNCNPRKIVAAEGELFGKSVLSKIGAEKCTASGDSVEGWDAAVGLTQKSVYAKQQITTYEVDYLLQRMLRQDSLSKDDKEVIEVVVNSVLASHYKNILMLIFEKFTSRIQYRSLTIFNEKLNGEMTFNGKVQDVCLSPSARSAISLTYKNMILEKLKKDKSANPQSFNIQNLLFTKAYLSVLTEQHKEDIAYDAGTLLAEAAQSANADLRNVFFSTLDWISTQRAKEILGLKARQLTDFVLTGDTNFPRSVVLATEEILGDGDLMNGSLARTNGGFFTLSAYGWYAPIDHKKTYNWYLGENNYQADIEKVTRPSAYQPEALTGPNKEQLLDDKAYRGMIVIGSNIRDDLAESVRDNYIYYLDAQGFLFYEPIEIPDAISYLKERVSGRQEKLDYFLKEAHSDGDYRNLFSINQKMFLIRAERQNGDILETVDILTHDSTYNPVFITNQDFGQWLKIREDEKLGGQFIYLNTSCSSYLKAAAELGAAASKNLVIIASATSVYTFSTAESNSTYHLFDGILKLKPFAEIETATAGLQGEYIFPHQSKYKDLVISKINAGYDIVTKVYKVLVDGTRQLFQIEQEINHAH